MFKQVQNKLYALNGTTSPNLRLPPPPEDDKFETEKDVLKYWIEEKQPKFTRATQPIHPNIILWLKKEDLVFGFQLDGAKYNIIIKKSKVKIPIKKQDYFTYIFYLKVRKQLRKNKIQRYFDDDGFILNEAFEVEKKFTDTRRSVDICFNVDEENSIGVEFLEDYHGDERKFNSNKQMVRSTEIMLVSSMAHWMFVWDFKLHSNNGKKCSMGKSDYLQVVVSHFFQKIQDYLDINDEKKWVVAKLNDTINNKKFCAALYDAYSNENKCIVSLSELIEALKIKDSSQVLEKFKKEVDFILKIDQHKLEENDDLDDLDSNDEEESEDEEDILGDGLNKMTLEDKPEETSTSTDLSDEKNKYFEEKENEIYLTNHGLTCFLGQINQENVQHPNDLLGVRMLQNNVAKAAYVIAVEMREKALKLKEEIIWGWDD